MILPTRIFRTWIQRKAPVKRGPSRTQEYGEAALELATQRWAKSRQGGGRCEQGFMLPSIIVISTTLFILGLAVSQLVISNQQAVVRGMYEQVAQTAAKSGVDYAKEQFVSTGTYDGTAEQTMIQNGNYRVTFEVTVLETSPDGLEKKIESVGKVYIPEQSTTQLLLSSIKTELIRTTTTAITPDEFSPLAWYDASDNPTVHEIGSTTANWTHLNTNDAHFLNERHNNGTQTNGSWNSTWISFGYNSILNSDTYTGVMFDLSGMPADVTVNNAHIQFTSHGTTIALSWIQIQALAMSALSAGTFSGPPAANQLRNQPTVGPAVNWGVLQWPIGGQAGPAQQTPNLRDLVQATLDQPGFNPSVHKIGFRLDRVLGIGNHRVTKGQASLVVNYSTTATSQAEDGDPVSVWDDKSGNGNHLYASSGNEPTYQTSEQNSNAMVQFPYSGGGGKFMETNLFDLLQQAQTGTVFVVSRAGSASGNNASLLRLRGAIPPEANCVGSSACDVRTYSLTRDGTGADMMFSINRSGSGGTAGQQVASSNIFNNTAGILAGGVAFGANSCNPNLDQAAIDLAHHNTLYTDCPGGFSNPKSFQNDLRLSVGTGDSGAIFDGYIGEIVVYDKQLSCQQVQSVQKYLRQKWFNDSSDNNVITCPAPPIPSF